LLDEVGRVLRSAGARTGWMLLVLHLSCLAAPGPKPHHRRVAAAVLDDVAGRCSGRLFGLSNGDLALLFRPGDRGTGMMALIARLFQSSGTDLGSLRSLWPLPSQAQPALNYLQSRMQDHEAPVSDGAERGGAFGVVDQLSRATAIEDLVVRHIAVHLQPGQRDRIVPLFQTIAVCKARLADRITMSGQEVEPLLLAHLAARLDERVVSLLHARPGTQAVHLRLPIAAVLSSLLDEVAADRLARRQAFGIEIPLTEMVADPAGAALARERLRQSGGCLVIDEVTPQMLRVTRLETLDPDLVKLNWPSIAPADRNGIATALRGIGRDRVVLSRCDQESALTWGLSLGIHRFQGEFVDTMLAAERLRSCAAAAACSLAQCRTRGMAAGAAGRFGCGNPMLLDMGLARAAV